MTVVVSGPEASSDAGAEAPRRVQQRRSLSDRFFRGVFRMAGAVVLVIMLLVGTFLTLRALPALDTMGWRFLTTQEWDPEGANFGVAGVLVGTGLIAAVAIAIAVPLAVGAALYITEYAPRRVAPVLVNLVDLMAAVPSVVYGIWGLYLLEPHLLVVGEQNEGLPRWLATYLAWFPLFRVDNYDPRAPISEGAFTSSTFIAGIIVAMMVTPIIASVMREVFSQAPVSEREGAYALGATKWGMIRSVVLPFGRGGMIGGTMLGLGRALGETIGVYLVISVVFVIQPHILQSGGGSISSLIALRYAESNEIGIAGLMAAGLVLFAMTLVVNFGAGLIISRSRSGAASDA